MQSRKALLKPGLLLLAAFTLCASRVGAQNPYGGGYPNQVPGQFPNGAPNNYQGNYQPQGQLPNQGNYQPQGQFPNGQYPNQGQYQNNGYQPQPQQYAQPAPQQNAVKPAAPAPNPAAVKQWFARYDQVRRQAQMTPAERHKADNMLSGGLRLFVSGDEKTESQRLLTSLVNKYQVAANQMKQLPLYGETEQLHRGYYQYFMEAKLLFTDYIKISDNILAKDPNTGESIFKQLIPRKASLENLEASIKELDAQTRSRFGVQPYRY